MKKKTTLVLTAASLLLMSPQAMAETTDTKPTTNRNVNETTVVPLFDDIEGHFAYKSVLYLTSKGIISGDGTKQFSPNKKIPLADFRTWISNLTQVKLDGENQTMEMVSRIEAATWIAKALGLADGGGKLTTTYRDTANLTREQQVLLHQLATLKVMVGDGNGNFRPNQMLTRGEAAVILDRVRLQILENRQQVPFTNLTGDLPETAYTMVQENQSVAGLFSAIEGDKRYLMAAMGEKPTAGYAISIVGVYEKDDALFVKVVEQSPEPGQPVAEAITYPYAVAEIKNTTKPIFMIKAKQGEAPQINYGGTLIKSQNVDLDNNGTIETVALVGTEKVPNYTDIFTKGYLGIFDNKGQKKQSFDLSGEAVNFPVQLTVKDLTKGGKGMLDILLESDLRANGGHGAHELNIFTQQSSGEFAAAPIKYPTDWSALLSLDYDKNGKAWLIGSKTDSRTWRVDLIGEQWKNYDPTTFMTKPYKPAVDPLYAVDVSDSVLKTKHYLWTGTHVNGIVGVVNTFKYHNNSFVLDHFDLESINEGTKVTKK